jgi:fumarate reductase subunit D
MTTMSETYNTIRITDGLYLTVPALVTLIGYIILAVLLLIPFDMYAWDDTKGEYVRYKYDIAQRLFLLVLLLFPLLLAVYSVNCFVVGKCHVLSWLVAGLTLLWAIIVITLAIIQRYFNLDNVLDRVI